MICPNCKLETKNGCCSHCGYLENGNIINCNKVEQDKFVDIKIYNEDFDIMYHNENSLFPMIFGNFYLTYHGHVFIGIIWGIVDFSLFLLVSQINIEFFHFITYYAIGLYLIVTRILYGTLMNSVCLKLDEVKIDRIKKKHFREYKNKLKKHRKSVFYIFINILVYIVIISLLILIRRIQNGTISDIIYWL